MQIVDSAYLIRVARALAVVHTASGIGSGRDRVKDERVDDVLGVLDDLRRQVQPLDMTFTIRALERAEVRFRKHPNPPVSYGEIRQTVRELQHRIEDELSGTLVLRVSPERAKFWGREDGFGERVSNVFPAAQFDVDEAHNCLALERYNAAVYHVMRALEHGLQALASHLGVTLDPHKTWYQFVNACRGRVKKMDKPDRKRYGAVLNHLDGVREVWRNDTMHPQDTPYTESQALRIFNNSKDLMQSVAKLCVDTGGANKE